MERVLPLVAESTAPQWLPSATTRRASGLIPDVRFEAPRKIVNRASYYGIPASDISSIRSSCPSAPGHLAGAAGVQVCWRRRASELKVNTTCGASNVSFGLPQSQHSITGHLPGHGHQQRHDVGDHEPDARRGEGCGHGGRRAGRQRPGLLRVDPRPTATPTLPVAPARAASAADAAGGSRPSHAADRVHAVGPRRHVTEGTSVLQAARELGVDLDSVCGGRGICGRCQITFDPGTYREVAARRRRHGAYSAGPRPNRTTAIAGIKPDRRLGCCALIADDVVLDVPPESQVHRPVVRKSLDLSDVVLDPTCRWPTSSSRRHCWVTPRR